MSETNLILVISNNQLKVAQSSVLGDESKDECKKILDFVQKISNDKLGNETIPITIEQMPIYPR